MLGTKANETSSPKKLLSIRFAWESVPGSFAPSHSEEAPSLGGEGKQTLTLLETVEGSYL